MRSIKPGERFGLGQSVHRLEDNRLLRGHGRYLDDIALPGALHAVFLRSPHAHADIETMLCDQARSMPGVAAILTAAEAKADGLGTIPCEEGLTSGRDGHDLAYTPRFVIANQRVRHVGDIVAMVIAESLAEAEAAAESIIVGYQALPAVTEAKDALQQGAPQIWPEAPGNLVIDWEMGDAAAVASAFQKAAHVTRLTLRNQRLSAMPLEPRGALASYEPATGTYTLYSSTQGVHAIRDPLADSVLRVPRDQVQVITPDVGGGFGMKLFLYPEYALVAWAARRLGRPVRWISTRSEAFLSDAQGRDQLSEAALALDEEGQFLALKVETYANVGAYLSGFGPYVPTIAGNGMLAGLYRTPAIHVAVKVAYTNTVPTDAYRGAGRPEAAYLIERMVDRAARAMSLSPDEIRRRNFIPPAAMPFATALGEVYDSGDFESQMREAMCLADWDGFPSRRAAAAERGQLRGIGMATYVEACGGGPPEMAELRIEPDGAAQLWIGTQSSGQGHATAYAQMLHEQLGLDLTRITVLQGDSTRLPYGTGTGGSRSIPVGLPAIAAAAIKVIEKSKKIAALLLESDVRDIDFRDGVFEVKGTDLRKTFLEIAAAAYETGTFVHLGELGLIERAAFGPSASTYPNGCHVAEIEIDPETGACTIVNYAICDDFGRVVNPLLLQGQVHGGTAQGIGQALYEACRYDTETGQLLTGSFMDYHMPRAADLPNFQFRTHNIPCRTNPLGIKGAGEAGAIGAPPAVMNAIVSALASFDISHLDMPATPETIWRAIQNARARP